MARTTASPADRRVCFERAGLEPLDLDVAGDLQ